MSSSEKWMVLRLAGPMMSWRLAGRKGTKMTYDHPTLSAMVGMIMSALGGERQDIKMTAEIASSLRMTSFNLSRPGDGALLEDFQTVGRGMGGSASDDSGVPFTAKLNDKGEWERGRKKIITRRYYLSDGRFLVMLSGFADKIDRYWEAIRRPQHPLFLGTHCCLCSERIDMGVYESEEAAMEAISIEAKSLGLKTINREADVDDVSQANNTLPDYPIQFGLATGGYGRRPVRDDILEV